jgi:hypothetical protein
MITPNELRIGNFLQWKSDIPNNYFNVKSVEDEYDWYEEYKGVPITKEWLLNFGFKFSTKQRSYSVIYDFIDSYKTFKVEICGNGVYLSNGTTYIKYIHQLQNLYFAITQKELTL